MVLCAVAFFPWFLPRETTSGLIGRWQLTENGWKGKLARKIAPWLDRYFHDPWGTEQCHVIFELEDAARTVLYFKGELDD